MNHNQVFTGNPKSVVQKKKRKKMLAKITTIKIIFFRENLGTSGKTFQSTSSAHNCWGKGNARNDHGTKCHISGSQGKARTLNCHLSKNCTRSTKPVYRFIMITLLLAIKLKATPNDNPTTNDPPRADNYPQKVNN